MKVLYINLNKDTERKAFMEQQLKELGFEYQRVSAVDGRMLSEEEVDRVYDSQASVKVNRKDLTRGEIGCALSHKKCHEIALEHDYTLILEDDIELPKNFKQIAEKQIAKNVTKKKWNYLQFDYPEVGKAFIYSWISSVLLYRKTFLSKASFKKKIVFWGYTTLKFTYILPISILEAMRNWFYLHIRSDTAGWFIRPLYLTGAYLVTNKAAESLLLIEKDIIFASDRAVNQARSRGLKHRAYVPLIVSQKWREFGSSIIGTKSTDYTDDILPKLKNK